MKEQLVTVILPKLPIVGHLEITSKDGKSIYSIDVVHKEPTTELSPFFQKCFEEFKQYLEGKTRKIKLSLDETVLTDFQKSVLIEMSKIQYGEVKSYKDIALKMNSRAYQAIGSACGKNPFLLIYPCHRIIGSKDLGGFAHGLKMKKELLRLEGINL